MAVNTGSAGIALAVGVGVGVGIAVGVGVGVGVGVALGLTLGVVVGPDPAVVPDGVVCPAPAHPPIIAAQPIPTTARTTSRAHPIGPV
ncbi:hypothetical protein [Pengzhenrongella frigida]|uniref:hypothetical protein n=1 Tax=Pengzhenrongella frigida TaxID=1259133 RepID=UPI001F5D7CA6|nr:hypothetical protein [Cellulomonas sp. HLT2-17]